MASQWSSPDVEIVVPVYNEAHVLQQSVRRLHAYLERELPVSWQITIVDNASTDDTFAVAQGLAGSLPAVQAVHLDRKGRGLALRTAWSASNARVLAYVDVDLSTDLAALGPLTAPLLSGHSDLAIGSRLSRTSRVIRGTKREFISRSYNGILRTVLSASFSDAQCGFKAITREAAARLLPLVKDDAWFFDTELLVLAERSNLRIYEVPVDWEDDPDSRVHIVQTAKDDLRGVSRLFVDLARDRIPVEAIAEELGRRPLAPAGSLSFASQAIRFAAIGAASTAAYALLFLLLRPMLSGQSANFLALLLTAVGNTWANRWFTFGVSGKLGAVRHHLQGLAVFGLAWAVTAGSLAALQSARPYAGLLTEIGVLTAANLIGTVLRFVLLRGWVFRTRRAAPASKRDAGAPSHRSPLQESPIEVEFAQDAGRH